MRASTRLYRLHAALLALLVALGPAPGLASQNALLSPTTGTVSGLALTNNINNALDSLNTANSGATAPVNQLSGSASLGNLWLNTTASPPQLSMNDGSANWPWFGALDTSNHQWDLQVGGGEDTLASATTTSICSVPHFFVQISGTTTITGLGTGCVVGQEKLLQFQGVLTFTNNAAIAIPGSASVATAAGDMARVVYLGAGNFQVEAYFPATGQALVNPAVPIGAKLDYFGGTVPAHFTLAYGQAISRASFPLTLAALTITQTLTRTSGSAILTGSTDTTQFGAGQPIEGSGIPGGATVLSTTGTTVTMSMNASSSGSANVTVFVAGGDGDGSTTLNMPDCRGVVAAGRDNMGGTARGKLTSTYAGANPDALGMTLGAQNHTQTLAELVAHTHSNTLSDPGHSHGGVFGSGFGIVVGTGASQISSSSGTTGTGTTGVTINNVSAGGGNPFSIVPPMVTTNCMLRTD